MGERNGLESLNTRLRALGAKVARESHILTAAQLAALEKAKVDKEAHGEVERGCPGYRGAQDTFSVGTLKGVGRISQQTFVAPYSKVAFAKLYDHKTSLTAAELLTEQGGPCCEAPEGPLSRILTARGTGYCGSPESHEDERSLAIQDIEHTPTKGKSPHTDGRVGRLQKTRLTEFYRITFRKKLYTTVAELQADVDEWLRYSNGERGHQGRGC